ncbi:helix-turn-helix transcriptional regulator [Bacillus sp. CH30_1T]|uniref:helix-turn-helix domain-containing protein n=1 Tax=Bacillus sp. CH30_1T TaxID=2604836 RepID=UPI0011EBAFCD|nr:helix-turn-helix transcriptional regulator [Bacillus sp. CH30_1T]KAA0564493.1 helix-turn-helix transcriptional regulator [Bacillus sp. CH30_1T]
MLEGKIIKFYREHREIKQKDLGEGICSTTHISKIERGLTEVSKETIQLLSDRLGIQMEKELENYKSIDSLLKEWHESIIKKLQNKADSIKKRLEGFHLLQIQDFYRTYTLILSRYHIFSGENQLAKRLIKEMEMWSELSPYEHNMLLHIKGIHHMRITSKPFQYLRRLAWTTILTGNVIMIWPLPTIPFIQMY